MSGYRHFKRFKQEQHKQKKSQEYLSKIPFSLWGPDNEARNLNHDIVNKVYQNITSSNDIRNNVVTSLEASQYLETYLWPLYNPTSSTKQYTLSVVLMVNQKFKERVPPWKTFECSPKFFPDFFRSVLELVIEAKNNSLSLEERNVLLTFLIHSFNSLEVESVREQVQKLVSLGIWKHLQPGRLEQELKKYSRLKKYWSALLKKDKQFDEETLTRITMEREFLYKLIQDFFSVLDSVPAKGLISSGVTSYCEGMMELLIDLEGQPLTRRFLNTLLDDVHLVVKCFQSNLSKREPEGHLFTRLLNRLKFYCGFEINDQTGDALHEYEMTEAHYNRITSLQLASFKLFPELRSFALSNVAGVDTSESLLKHFGSVTSDTLHNIAAYLNLLPVLSKGESTTYSKDFLLQLLVALHERRPSQLESINNTPLYPTEEILWDESVVPYEYFDGEERKKSELSQGILVNSPTRLAGDDCEQTKNMFDFGITTISKPGLKIQSELSQGILVNSPTRLAGDDCEQTKNMFDFGMNTTSKLGRFALPKLNLQFLTLHDYLLRNLTLFRLESTYEIREDVEDAIGRMKPWVTPDSETQFAGWARMALPIIDFSIVEVGKPKIGENRPSRVRADVGISIGVKDHVKHEWEALRKHDVCFLVTVRAKLTLHEDYNHNKNFAEQVGIDYVRGCEVEGLLDDEGKLIEEGPEPKPELRGDKRTFRLWLDTNQYQKDMESVVKGSEDVYETFSIFMRRKPKENNFKAVVETIRDLMNTECVVPDWIHDVFLGYGDPAAAHYTRLPVAKQTMDFNDTFLCLEHLKDSFPQYTIQCTADNERDTCPPFRITFSDTSVKRKLNDDNEDKKQTLLVEPYTIPIRGPYPYNVPKRNTVPFTPTQVEAIRAGMQPGLTMVVGPPGTGKTDVAVQIISNLYHNFPDQRTLLVTHSNQALNQLFEKIMALDIDERHLLRLGHGEEELQTEKDFSRFGRVNFILALRLELLKEVERLQNSLNVTGDVSYTCETAGHFFLYQVVCRWEKYCAKIKQLGKTSDGLSAIREQFPFTRFFSNAPQPLFKGESFSDDWEVTEGCFRHIRKIFKQLEEFRAFELLRTSRDRVNYLLTKEAKIIALTCTHAALKRRDLVGLSFKYDNILMEEAAQILEVETFIPLMLQNPQDGHNRLKRVIMIGDHHQLPPVIKNMAFQKFSNMEQSMFTRFVRLGVPLVQLDAQGRARPSLCSLYNWRYHLLGNLPHVMRPGEYQLANPGFVFDHQLINVEDFNGVGETTPTPFFYQNLAEAEYAVGLFMYMRLQGYPPEKITILTTYNGQKHLIRDVLNKRCARNQAFGLPEKVTTVDRYQGQQNDYIILSLVRTRHIGHLRDVRRLVVAMSRARLGLYIVARVSLFRRCNELQPAFNILMNRPQKLHLTPLEYFPPSRHNDAPPNSPVLIIENMPHLAELVYHEYQTRVAALRASHQQIARPPLEDDSMKRNKEENVEASSEETTEKRMENGEEESQGKENMEEERVDDKLPPEDEQVVPPEEMEDERVVPPEEMEDERVVPPEEMEDERVVPPEEMEDGRVVPPEEMEESHSS